MVILLAVFGGWEMAKAEKRKTNPIALQAGMSIGTNAAEFDEDFLLQCFVHYPPVELCLNVKSRGMVVDGRTGAGKTAILKYVKSIRFKLIRALIESLKSFRRIPLDKETSRLPWLQAKGNCEPCRIL